MPKSTQKNHKKLYIWIAGLLVAIPILCVGVLLLFALQIPQYSYYYAKCGFTQPVKIEHNASQSYTYLLPTSFDYDSATLFVTGYYCTEQEAIDAGYGPSPQ